jgi:hypothetical protein
MAFPRKKRNDGEGTNLYSLKKCPFCFEMLKLDADKCERCNKKVGSVNKTGFADKPVNWKAYMVSILAWVAFGVYCYWAFVDR